MNPIAAQRLAKRKEYNLANIARLEEEDARKLFAAMRWPETEGRAVCPRCSGEKIYYPSLPTHQMKCANCNHKFSLSSGTIFSNRKMAYRDIIMSFAIFEQAAKGVSSLHLARNLGVQQKTAFLLLHKIREAIRASLDDITLQGVVEIDGAYFGGHRRRENIARHGLPYRVAKASKRNRRVIVILREHGGRTIPIVVKKESEAVEEIARRVLPGTIIHADGARAWDSLSSLYEMMRIEHKYAFIANGACTNLAESYYAMLRRCQMGVHHQISAKMWPAYSAEIAWRLDHKKLDGVERFGLLLQTCLSAEKTVFFRDNQHTEQRKLPDNVIEFARRFAA